jgi:transketolase
MIDKKKLEEIARLIRIDIIKMINQAGSGHPAGSLGITDILTSLYFGILKHSPQNSCLINRDRFLLSAGHLVPALYATLAHAGYFPKKELMTLRAFGSRLQGHSHFDCPGGVEIGAGLLGQGLSVTCGKALAAKMNKQAHKIVCLTSDGEQNEGQTWEAAMLASKYKLDNLIQIVDRNHIQIDGTTEEIMPIEPLNEKYQAFGWIVYEIDGHNFDEIFASFKKAFETHKKPTVIISNTIPGKGVSFMENNWDWHGKAPNNAEAEKAIKELEKNA